jgi:hypothetical protein
MTNYLSTAARAQISGVFDNVHETFQRTITAYQDAESNIIVMSPSYNSLYGTGGSSPSTVTKTVVSREISARIRYISGDEDFLFGASNAQVKVTIPRGSIRIKVATIDKDFIKEAKRIEFDGIRYNIVSDSVGIGPFAPNYFSFFLTPIDEDA